MKLHDYTIQAIIDLYKEYKSTLGNEDDFLDRSKSINERLASLRNPNRRKIVSLIDNLEPEAKAELLAVMWIGRGDGTAKDFKFLKKHATEMSDMGDAEYATEKPLDDYLSEGMKILGIKIEET
jgi:hypothetical protein